MSIRIDAHQHYWKLERGDYGWLTPEAGELYRDYMPDELRPQLERASVNRTIAVQAAPTVAETEFLLQLSESEPTLAGAVGWLDLEAADFEEQFLLLRSNPYFIGLRPMLQDLEDDAYILRPQVMKSLQLLVEHDFPIDLLVKPRHLPVVIKLLQELPGLRAVIDHIAKPDIASGVISPWNEHMEQIASNPNVYCKLSGMVTEAKHKLWRESDFIPYVHHIVKLFGSGRVMFGSDWPVCRLSAEYEEVVRLLETVLPEEVTKEEKDKIFGQNALTFYQIKL